MDHLEILGLSKAISLEMIPEMIHNVYFGLMDVSIKTGITREDSKLIREMMRNVVL